MSIGRKYRLAYVIDMVIIRERSTRASEVYGHCLIRELSLAKMNASGYPPGRVVTLAEFVDPGRADVLGSRHPAAWIAPLGRNHAGAAANVHRGSFLQSGSQGWC